MKLAGIDNGGEWYPGTDGMTTEIVIVLPLGSGSFGYRRPEFTADPSQLRMTEYFGDVFHAARYVRVEL